MTTLATRLAQLSGLPVGAHTMAQHLRAMVTRFGLAVPASATVAAILIAYSGLPAGQYTVAEHLAVERSASRGVVITAAYLERMRARRLALQPVARERERERREAEEELEEIAMAAEQAPMAEVQAACLAAESATREFIARLVGGDSRADRLRRQQQLVVAMLAH